MKKLLTLALSLTLLFSLCLPVAASAFTEKDLVGTWVSHWTDPEVPGSTYVRVSIFHENHDKLAMSYIKRNTMELFLNDEVSGSIVPDRWEMKDDGTIAIYDDKGELCTWYFVPVDNDTMIYYDSTWKITYHKLPADPNEQVRK